MRGSLKCLFVLWLFFTGAEITTVAADNAFSGGVDMSVEETIKNAERGDPEAQFQLADLLRREGGDPEKIIHLLSAAAEQDHVFATTNLGIFYYFGDFVEKSYDKAASLFLKSAKLGDPSAQYYLGLSLLNGTGVKKNEKTGLRVLKMASEAGMPHAQLELAKCYEDGIGIDTDLFEAVSWYAYAAKSGLAEASKRFNEIYYSTQFEDENGEQKFFWFELEAMENGNLPGASEKKKKLSDNKVWVEVDVDKVSR